MFPGSLAFLHGPVACMAKGLLRGPWSESRLVLKFQELDLRFLSFVGFKGPGAGFKFSYLLRSASFIVFLGPPVWASASFPLQSLGCFVFIFFGLVVFFWIVKRLPLHCSLGRVFVPVLAAPCNFSFA